MTITLTWHLLVMIVVTVILYTTAFGVRIIGFEDHVLVNFRNVSLILGFAWLIYGGMYLW